MYGNLFMLGGLWGIGVGVFNIVGLQRGVRYRG